MKERPILFSAPMVRAILDGKKTQTRRIVKPQPKDRHLGYMAVDGGALLNGPDYPDGENDFVRCPYGVAGDRLWVRETFLPCTRSQAVKTSEATYACFRDGSQKFTSGEYFQDNKDPNACIWPENARWKPSIHMPRWASRITLEVVAVRVERLHEITDFDAVAEGFGTLPLQSQDDPSAWWEYEPGKGQSRTASGSFRNLWHKINGADSWAANPWVWVVEFKQLKGSAS